jgi:DNA repair exonuclease SbcCD ATPase subunit
VGASLYLTKPAPVPALIAALRDASFQCMRPAPPDEVVILKQYNGALLKKLDDKEATLQQTLQKLQRAHERNAEPNRALEHKMEKRTAELAKANGELRDALAQVKQLSDLLPVCSGCKKIRDDQSYRQFVENYLTRVTEENFSHLLCLECQGKQTAALHGFVAEGSPVCP